MAEVGMTAMAAGAAGISARGPKEPRLEIEVGSRNLGFEREQ